MKRLLLLLGFVLTSISCEHNEIQKIDDPRLKVSDFSQLGSIHNSFLVHAEKNFNPPNEITTMEEGLNYLNGLSKTFVKTLSIPDKEKAYLEQEFDKYEHLYVEKTAVGIVFDRPQSPYNRANIENDDDSDDIFDNIDALKAAGYISETSHEILVNLSNDLKSNYLGEISDQLLKENIQAYIELFDTTGFIDNSEGEMIGAILAISVASLDWWDENTSALDGLAARGTSTNSAEDEIAPWLAVDIVGAVIGGTAAAVGQELLTDDVNWEMVAWSAAVGAVATSTGAAGRIAKWLFRLK